MANNHEFKLNDTVYVVERDLDGKAQCVVSWLLFVAQVGHVAIVENNSGEEIYTEEELLSSMLYETAGETMSNLLAFPIKDCYHTLKEAHGALDVAMFTEAMHDELQ